MISFLLLMFLLTTVPDGVDWEKGIALFQRGYDNARPADFSAAYDHFLAASRRRPKDYRIYQWQGTALFHRALLYLFTRNKNTPQGKSALTGAMKALNTAVRLYPKDADSHAMISTITGIMIGLEPLTMPWRGPKVMRHKDLALKYGPKNPRCYYLIGMSYFHGPGWMGGPKTSLRFLMKAAGLFQAEKKRSAAPGEARWGHSACLAFIAQVHQKTGRPGQALTYYQKALAVNPKEQNARWGLAALQKKEKK